MANPITQEYTYIETSNVYLSNRKVGIRGERNNTMIFLKVPAYHIPIHLILALVLANWRDKASSPLDKAIRRLTNGAALAVLGIIGIIDTVARTILGILARPINAQYSSLFFQGVTMGALASLYYLTKTQLANACADVLFSEEFLLP